MRVINPNRRILVRLRIWILSNNSEVELSSRILISTSKKTLLFFRSLIEEVKDKAFDVLKAKEFTPPQADDCFQNESNAVFGVFLQRLINQ
jgi:hypothetical protein